MTALRKVERDGREALALAREGATAAIITDPTLIALVDLLLDTIAELSQRGHKPEASS